MSKPKLELREDGVFRDGKRVTVHKQIWDKQVGKVECFNFRRGDLISLSIYDAVNCVMCLHLKSIGLSSGLEAGRI